MFKAAYVTPRTKKADMDPTDPRSYRPISNLPVSSKLLERLVARQLLAYLNTSWPASVAPICVSTSPLNRDGHPEGSLGYITSY